MEPRPQNRRGRRMAVERFGERFADENSFPLPRNSKPMTQRRMKLNSKHVRTLIVTILSVD